MNLDTNVIPIKITVPFEDFVKAYKAAKLNNCSKSKGLLLAALYDQFLLWEKLIVGLNLTADITVATFFALLKMDDRPKDSLVNKHKNLLNYCNYYNVTVFDLLVEAMLSHIEKQTVVYSNYTKPKKFFFYLSKEIKTFLFKSVRKILQQIRRDYYTNPSFFKINKAYSTIFIDTQLLSRVEKTNPLLYSAYLFFLVNPTFSDYTLRDKFNISIKQSKQLYEELCQLIKTLPSSS